MKAFIVVCWICMLPVGINTQITPSNCVPSIAPDLVAKITTNTVILQQPTCCFDNLTNLTCTKDKCQVWLVAALDSAISTFDTDKTTPNILRLSSYPSAFADGSKKYFLTKVGPQESIPCGSSDTKYFTVGADGQCSTTNCNGVLPEGSTTRFKYLLVDPTSEKVLAETKWSEGIILYTTKDPSTINEGLAGRSAAMIVITVILAVAMAVLLLFLLVILGLTCCGGKGTGPGSVMGSFRIPRYDTHNLKNPSPYDNPAYERETRQYSTAPTLPKSTVITSVVHDDPNAFKMQKI